MTEPTIAQGGQRQIIDNAGQEVFGEVADSPTANTVLARLKAIEDALDSSTAVTPPTAFYHGQKAVTTAGTAEALGTTQALKRGVLVKALSTNTGLVYVGGEDVDSDTGFELEAGDLTYIEIDDLAKVYVDAAEAGEGVSYVAS